MSTDLAEIVRARLAAKASEGKRPTQADLLWLDAVREHAQPSSSVELSRNAKGDTQITVKVAHPDPRVAESEAQAIFERQRAIWPMQNGTVGAPMVEPEPKGKKS